MPIAFVTLAIMIPITDEGGDDCGEGPGSDDCGPINPAVLSKSFLVRWNEVHYVQIQQVPYRWNEVLHKGRTKMFERN